MVTGIEPWTFLVTSQLFKPLDHHQYGPTGSINNSQKSKLLNLVIGGFSEDFSLKDFLRKDFSLNKCHLPKPHRSASYEATSERFLTTVSHNKKYVCQQNIKRGRQILIQRPTSNEQQIILKSVEEFFFKFCRQNFIVISCWKKPLTVEIERVIFEL